VEPPPPRILAAVSNSGDGAASSGASKVKKGQLLAITVDNLALPGAVPDPGRITVKLGGVEMRVAQMLEQGNLYRVLVAVSEAAPTGSDVPLTLAMGTRTSDAFSVVVERAN
jgi:hypothetical protein